MSASHFLEDEEPGRFEWSLWQQLARYAWPHRRLVIPLAIAAVAVAGCDAGLGLVTIWIVDELVARGPEADMRWPIVAFAVMAVILATGVWVFVRMAGGLANHMSHDIRRDCFAKLQQLEFAFFDTRPTGWILSRLTSDCDKLARVISWGTMDLLWGGSLVLAVSAVLLVIHWPLALVVLSVVPPLALASAWFQTRILRAARHVRRMNSKITAAFNECIQGVRTTKTLVREEPALEEFSAMTGEMFEVSMRRESLAAFYYPLVVTLGTIAAGLALWKGGFEVTAGTLTLGTLVGFMNYAGQFFNPINQMALVLTEMQGAQAAAERVATLLRTKPAIADSEAVQIRIREVAARPRRPDEAPDGFPDRVRSIRFENVSFGYTPSSPVLRDFSLEARSGETIALVGPSGGGKSTIVSLVCRFYEPTSGRILFDGVDVRDRSLAWLQSRLGIVLQAPHLFRGSLLENIRFGRLEASDAEVREAARLVNAHVFIERLPDGYATDVGEGGNRLSTGQKQLVSFARALLANPHIFVMDEATASVDTETEQLIQRGLHSVLRGRLSFVIAHRLSTIRSATRILVIEGGRIQESGTHAELLAQRGHYYALYTTQFRREQEDKIAAMI